MIMFKNSLELMKFFHLQICFLFFFFSRIKGFLMIAQDIEIY